MAAVLARRLLAGLWLGAALATAAAAQAAGWEVRTLKAQNDSEATFPWVAGPVPAVADRISTLLFLDVLESAPPRGNPVAFMVPGGKASVVPVMPAGFRVLRLDARLLSIAIAAESCGAYCEAFERSFVLDLADGHRATDAELLTAAGRAALAKKSAQAFAGAIGARLAKLAKQQPADLSADDRETIRSVYTECREQRRQWARESRMSGRFKLGKSGAEIVCGRCTPHALRALDELGDFTYRVPLAELTAALTPCGRALVLGEGKAPAGAGPAGQVFAGTLGGAAIRAYVGPLEEDGSLGGSYYDERDRKPIPLSGKLAGAEWSMTEDDDAGKARGEWLLEREGIAWIGSWAAADGRRLPVRLAP